jgi:hypothetical protein
MMSSRLIPMGSFGTFIFLWSTIALRLYDGEFESSISMHSTSELCFDCAIYWIGHRDIGNICIWNSIFLFDFGKSLSSTLGRRVLQGWVTSAWGIVFYFVILLFLLMQLGL